MSEKETKPTTLTDEEIVSDDRKELGRRNAISLLGVGVAGAMALATGCVRRARVVTVVQGTGITDRDGGPCADPGGNGRGVSGITDSDGGACADPVNRGRGGARVVVQQPQPVRVQVQTGITDRDGGQCADPAGGGRGYSGLTDSDGGYCSDPAGRGRSGY